jgi:imidazolonepropionase-like amidohydrolase
LTAPSLILAGRLIDGTGAPPLERGALVLRDGRITEVLPQSELARTQRAEGPVLDLGEATVLPGLIDPHVHLGFNAGPTHAVVRRAVEEESDAALALRSLANAQAHLAGGVTTVRDVGGRGFVALAVRDAVRSRLALGPRIQASGPAITPTRGHLNYLGAIANNAGEVRAWATRVLDEGADLVKVCASGGIMTAESDPLESHYTEAELRNAVEVAEERGTLVAAHVLAGEALGRCVRAGVRSIEHCMWQDEPGVFRFDPEIARVMRERGVFAGFTFSGLGQVRYREQKLGMQAGEDLGVWRERLDARFAAERETVAAGVRYVLHSDSGVRSTPFGPFWMVVAAACFELRITPLEAIRAVTSTAASLLGWEGEVGELRPGAWADLMVVDGDPSVTVEALASPRLVLKGGQVVSEAGVLRAIPLVEARGAGKE